MTRMIKKTELFVLGALVAIALGHVQSAFAASTLSIAPSGEGAYVLQGIGMESAAAMDITVSYDPATLASPRLTQGAMISGAMVAINDTVPGAVRIGIVRTTPVKGTGVILTLTFNKKGDAPGKILGLKASLSNIDGKPLLVTAQIAPQDDTTADAGGSSSGRAGASLTAPGSVTPQTTSVKATGPGEDKKKTSVDHTSGTGMAGAVPISPSTTISADAAGMTVALDASGKKVQQYDSVLKKFKKFKGERSAKALIGLFAQDEIIGFHQEPAVALSDGTTPVRAVFISSSVDKTAADVAVMGARLVSMKKDPENTNTWIAELIPEKDTHEASFAVLEGALKRIYPLTVAPKIDMKTGQQDTVAETDFARYLNNQRRDVNKDGKKNYLDDYIFTANYLFVTKSGQTSVKSN